MKPTAEQIEQIQTLLVNESSSVAFRKKGTKEDDGYWYLTNNNFVIESGPWKDGNPEWNKDRSVESFVKFAADNELIAEVNIEGSYHGEVPFDSWEHLARFMGIGDLVVISTKIPKKVAAKFEYYATKDTTVSEKLRSLVYSFVIEQIKENAEKDAFR